MAVDRGSDCAGGDGDADVVGAGVGVTVATAVGAGTGTTVADTMADPSSSGAPPDGGGAAALSDGGATPSAPDSSKIPATPKARIASAEPRASFLTRDLRSARPALSVSFVITIICGEGGCPMRLLLFRRRAAHTSNAANSARVTKGDPRRAFILPILLPCLSILNPALTIDF
jgi:hypothetical protein